MKETEKTVTNDRQPDSEGRRSAGQDDRVVIVYHCEDHPGKKRSGAAGIKEDR